MNDLFDIVLQSLRDSFPKLNWKMGSVLRTLLVEPLITVSDSVKKYTKQYESSLNLESIVNSPAGKESELNRWMDILGIADAEQVPASGTVAVILSDNINLTVVEGARFTWNDEVTLFATEQSNWGPGAKSYRQLSSNRYVAEIPVNTTEGSAISLNSGAPVNWENAPDEVVDMYVQSPISGGHSNGVQDKAAAIRSLLASPTACGEDSIRASLIRQFGSRLCDVKLSRQNVGVAPTVSMYIKQSAMPADYSYSITPEVVRDDPKKLRLRFRINTSGVTAVHTIYTQSGVPLNISLNPQLSSGNFGDSGSYAVYDAEYLDPALFSFTVKVTKFQDAVDAVDWLNSTQCSLPFRMTAKLPAYVDVRLQINTNGVPIPAEAKNAICEFINGTVLDASITDNDIKALLSEFGIAVTGSVLFVGVISLGDRSTSATSTGILSVQNRLLVNDVPVALYCSASNITSY